MYIKNIKRSHHGVLARETTVIGKCDVYLFTYVSIHFLYVEHTMDFTFTVEPISETNRTIFAIGISVGVLAVVLLLVISTVIVILLIVKGK